METHKLATALGRLSARHWGGKSQIDNLQRLSGGANMESWKFSHQGEDYVLRRAPDGFAEAELDQTEDTALSLADQAELIDHAQKAGIKAPEIVAMLQPDDGMGDGFVMRCISGETLPGRILRKPQFAEARANLTRQCAAELARLHAITLPALPIALDHMDTPAMVAQLAQRYHDYGALLPAYALALRWLAENIPAHTKPALLHGDFRMGNLMVNAEGLSGVLDWELAHIGDPAQDLAYLCMPSWRFGHYDQPVGGFGQIAPLLDAYAAAGGETIAPSRFIFWLIYSCLWWGLCCLQMTAIWRDGRDNSLERAVIGRRASEVELDLLLLLEEQLAAPQTPLAINPAPERVAGATSDAELAQAIGTWMDSDALDTLSGHRGFERRVAANALGMLERSAQERPAERQQRLERAAKWQQYITKGGKISDKALWHDLRRDALITCTMDQPKYAGLIAAKQKWPNRNG